MLEIFSYSFMLRALVVGLILAVSAALLGVSLVLRKNSMIGDGLSHVSFGATALALVFGLAPLEFAIPITIIVSFLLLKLQQSSKLSGDSAIALISASSLAIGVMAVSIKGVNIDLNSYLFGSILSVTTSDIITAIILGVIIIAFYIFFYKHIFALTFDETFAKSIGIKTNWLNIAFAVLSSVVVVLGLKMMGALLISSLIIFPCLTSRQLFKSFKSVTIASVIISTLCLFIGLIASFYLGTPTGATIVCANLITFLIAKLIPLMV